MNLILRSFILILALTLLAGCASKPKHSAKPNADENSKIHQQSTKAASSNAQHIKIKPSSAKSASVTPVIIEQDFWARLRKGFQLPELGSKRVAYYEKKYAKNPEHLAAIFTRAQWFLPYILDQIEQRQFPTELALLPAVESAFKPSALSRSGASGLWQFIPSTGKLFGLKQNWWYDARRDPILATQAALDFFEELSQRFDDNWFHAMAAYNAGGYTIERAIKKRQSKGLSSQFLDLSLRRETTDYVPKIMAYRNIIANPEKYNITLPKINPEQPFSKLKSNSQMDIRLFSNKSHIDLSTLRFLNSAYQRDITPPQGPYYIYVPSKDLNLAKKTLASLSSKDKVQWTQYRVKEGDVLGRIAHAHNVSVASIRQSNQLSAFLIHTGQVLRIPSVGKITHPSPTDLGRKGKQVTYLVSQGDTLWSIAKRYGVKIIQLSQWNKIAQSATLSLGQKITIFTRS